MVFSEQSTEIILAFAAIAAITVIAAIASFFVGIPLAGVLIRVRANYVPKRLQLDIEAGESVPDVVVNSYFGMMKKVYRIEGWSGLYKGIWGNILAGLASGLISGLIPSQIIVNPTRSTTPSVLPSIINSVLTILVTLPSVVLIYRSVVTPYKLPTSKWRRNLRILFTDDERRHFWNIYKAPGLLLALFVRAILLQLILFGLLAYLNAATTREDLYRPVPVIICSVWALVAIAIDTPLDVIITKLAIQRNGSDSESIQVIDQAAKYPGEEDVIRFREEEAPYKGFVDCIKKIVDEEGWRALYRAWYITLLGIAIAVFALAAAVVLSKP